MPEEEWNKIISTDITQKVENLRKVVLLKWSNINFNYKDDFLNSIAFSVHLY